MSTDDGNPVPLDPFSQGFRLSSDLHYDGDGSRFSVSYALLSRELGARGYKWVEREGAQHSKHAVFVLSLSQLLVRPLLFLSRLSL